MDTTKTSGGPLMPLMTSAEVAALLRVDRNRLSMLVRSGRIPGARKLPGLGWRFQRLAIERLVGSSN